MAYKQQHTAAVQGLKNSSSTIAHKQHQYKGSKTAAAEGLKYNSSTIAHKQHQYKGSKTAAVQGSKTAAAHSQGLKNSSSARAQNCSSTKSYKQREIFRNRIQNYRRVYALYVYQGLRISKRFFVPTNSIKTVICKSIKRYFTIWFWWLFSGYSFPLYDHLPQRNCSSIGSVTTVRLQMRITEIMFFLC
jgi:hypothetical protein